MLLLAVFLLATAQLWAEDEESFDALPEERVGELQPKEMREAISQVASYTPPAPATGGAPVSLDHPSARSLRYGSRQADLRAAVEGQDAAAVEKAFERMVAAAGDSEPGPRAERRKARVLELAKQEKWQKAQALVSRIIRDRRRHYQARQGEDQTTFVMLGAWLRFAQLGGTARCAGPADAGGAILNPVLTAKVTDRVGQLPAAVRAVPVAQRALDAFGKISPLATPKVAKAAGCQVKELAGQALAGL